MSRRFLALVRFAAGASQSMVARDVHVDRATLSRIENGVTLPTPAQATRLEKVFGQRITTLLQPVEVGEK